MSIFLSTLNQMGFFMLLIAVGYILVKFNLVEEGGTKILSKLENYLFIPALVLSTFISNFTVKTFSTAWKFLACGTVVVLLSAVFAVFASKLCIKDEYILLDDTFHSIKILTPDLSKFCFIIIDGSLIVLIRRHQQM